MSIQPQVADHYNQIKQKTRGERQASAIIGVKRFNNWVKSVLIHRYAATDAVVLDLCCGKGGDLAKFVKANIRYYVGADHASVSVKDALERYNELHPIPFLATFICADCHAVKLSRALEPEFPRFDLVSCQFALHYSFESEARARMFSINIGERLKPGGYFVSTFPDSSILQLKLRAAVARQKAEAEEIRQRALAELGVAAASAVQHDSAELKLEFGNSVYSVRFTSPCPFIESEEPFDESLPPPPPLPSSPFGVQYTFDLTDAISDCPEYLVHMPTLCSLLAEFDMELIYSAPLHQFFLEHSSHPEYARLMKQMKIMGSEVKKDLRLKH